MKPKWGVFMGQQISKRMMRQISSEEQNAKNAFRGVVFPNITRRQFFGTGAQSNSKRGIKNRSTVSIPLVDRTDQIIRISKISADLMSKESFERPYAALTQLGIAIGRLIGTDNETLVKTEVAICKDLNNLDSMARGFAELHVSFAGREHTKIEVFSSPAVWIKHGKNPTAFLSKKEEVQELLVQVLTDYAVRKNVTIRFDIPTTGLLG